MHRIAAAVVSVISFASFSTASLAGPLSMDFQDGVSGWRVVLDGVMGGLSTGRVSQPSPGILRFSGELSLENNGGFSQIRTSVPENAFVGTDGVEFRVLGDGRTYTFDIRCSDVRLMAGGFQSTFETESGTWQTFKIPFDQFRLYSFGRRIRNAPELVPARIESIGVTLADKQPGPFALEMDSIEAYRAGDTRTVAATSNDLGTVASDAGLTTLLELVKISGITDALPANERLTVFAPTNDAFAALPPEQVRTLTKPENRPLLRKVLAHHVVASPLPSATLLQRRSVTTLSNQRIAINADDSLMIGNARILATDVPFDSGVVHVIDSVLVPETRTIDQILTGSPKLNTLAAAVTAAGLLDQLGPANEGPWTIFAPTDAAFDALPEGTLEDLLTSQGRDQLTAILALHVVPGRLYHAELPGARTTRTLSAAALTFGLKGGKVRVNDSAMVVTADIEASNGVIHLIDRVLLPAATETESSVATRPFDAATALLEKAVDLGVPMFNDGNVEACSAIYELAITAILELAPERLDRPTSQRLQRALAEAEAERDHRSRAWIYRRGIDDVYTRLMARNDGLERTARHTP